MSLEIKNLPAAETEARLALSGSLDSETAPDLERALEQVSAKTIIFNMKELSFISSAGLRVIFATLKKQKATGGKVAVCNTSPGVKKVFEIVKALPDLNIFSSTQELDDYLASFQ